MCGATSFCWRHNETHCSSDETTNSWSAHSDPTGNGAVSTSRPCSAHTRYREFRLETFVDNTAAKAFLKRAAGRRQDT